MTTKSRRNINADAERLARLLEKHDLKELLAKGELLDPVSAAKRAGMSPQHIRRLCADDKLPCVNRQPPGVLRPTYFIFPDRLDSIFHAQGQGK